MKKLISKRSDKAKSRRINESLERVLFAEIKTSYLEQPKNSGLKNSCKIVAMLAFKTPNRLESLQPIFKNAHNLAIYLYNRLQKNWGASQGLARREQWHAQHREKWVNRDLKPFNDFE